MEAIFKKFYMLETLKFDGNTATYTEAINLTSEMAVARNLKILEVHGITVGTMDRNLGKFWSNLEYFHFFQVFSWLQTNDNPIEIDMISWKNMKQLKYFDMEFCVMNILDLILNFYVI